MLVSAAATVYVNSSPETHQPNVSMTIDKCVHYDDSSDMVRYASSTEAFPGLLFYTMLSSGSNKSTFDKLPNISAVDRHAPGMSSPTFFEDRPDRRDFFNTFGTYAFMVTTLSKSKVSNSYPVNVSAAREGIRWMPTETINCIRASAGKQLWDSQAAYLSLLGFFAHPSNLKAWLGKEGLLNYFRDKGPAINGYKPLAVSFRESYSDIRAFFALPVMYSARVDFVDTTRPTPISTGGGGGVSSSIISGGSGGIDVPSLGDGTRELLRQIIASKNISIEGNITDFNNDISRLLTNNPI